MAAGIDEGLAAFDVPRAAVEPLLRSLRMVNTAADALFYDVGVLWQQLFARGIKVSTAIDPAAARPGQTAALPTMPADVVNLSALTDPEGVILVVDARTRAVHRALRRCPGFPEEWARIRWRRAGRFGRALDVPGEDGFGYRGRQLGARLGRLRLECVGGARRAGGGDRARLWAGRHHPAGAQRLLRLRLGRLLPRTRGTGAGADGAADGSNRAPSFAIDPGAHVADRQRGPGVSPRQPRNPTSCTRFSSMRRRSPAFMATARVRYASAMRLPGFARIGRKRLRSPPFQPLSRRNPPPGSHKFLAASTPSASSIPGVICQSAGSRRGTAPTRCCR